ncbi:hypothetical protein D3C85_94640 [compost metagenome]
MAEGIRFHAQVLTQGAGGLARAACQAGDLNRSCRRVALVEHGLHDRLRRLQHAVQHRHHRGQIRRIGHGAAAQVVQTSAEVRQPFPQALRLFGVTDVRGAGDGIADAGVAVQRMRQMRAGAAAQPARRVGFQQVGRGHQRNETVFGAVQQIHQLMRPCAAGRAGVLHFADTHAGGFQRRPLCAALRFGDGRPGLRSAGWGQARIHARQGIREIRQAAIAVRHGVGRVFPGASAPDQRRHQHCPDRAGQEEQGVGQALGQRGRRQFRRHHEACRQQRADNGGGRPEHPQQPAEGAAGKGQRQQQPKMAGAGAGQETEQRADQPQRQHGARALAQRPAGVAEAGPEGGDGGPAQPRLVRQHGQDDGGRADRGGLQGVQPQHVAQRGAPEGKQFCHAGSTAEVRREMRRTQTLACRQEGWRIRLVTLM